MSYKKISKRYFGVEVEMSTSYEIVEYALKRSKLFPSDTQYADGFSRNATDGKKFFLMIDGSTETEFVTPKLTLKSKKYEMFKKMVQFFNDKKFEVTDRDGLHIHVDCSDVHPDQVLTAWLYIENKIKMAFPYKRRKFNKYGYSVPYCRKYSDKPLMNSFSHAKEKHVDREHHTACSFFSYNTNKDVEIRFMEGTLDMNTIEMWIKFCLHFIEFAKNMEVLEILQEPAFSPDDSFEKLCDEMKIRSKSMIEWLNSREIEFKLKK